MRRFMKRALVAMLALMLMAGAVLPAAYAVDVTMEQAETLSRINVWENGSVVLKVGRTMPLYMAKVVDGKPYLKEGTITFYSDNGYVASVAPQLDVNGTTYGLVTALNPGVASIVLQASDGTTYWFQVTVVGDTFEFTSSTLTSYIGEKTDLNALLNNNLSNAGTVSWKTSKKTVASVNASGVITAKKAGKATITASAGGKSTKITVTVKKNKLDKIQAKPTVSMANGKNARLMLKSVEIQATNKIVVEYYLINASRYRLKKIDYINTTITAYDRVNNRTVTLVKGKSGAVSPSMKSKSVKVIKVTYTGGKVKNTNVNLKNCSGGMEYNLSYYVRFG